MDFSKDILFFDNLKSPDIAHPFRHFFYNFGHGSLGDGKPDTKLRHVMLRGARFWESVNPPTLNTLASAAALTAATSANTAPAAAQISLWELMGCPETIIFLRGVPGKIPQLDAKFMRQKLLKSSGMST